MNLLNNLFINVLIIISSISVNGYLFREKIISRKSKKLERLLFGLNGLIMACALMYYSIRIPGTTTIIDFRFFPLIYVFYFAGILPTVVTGLGIIIYRFSFFGIDQASIIAAITILVYIVSYYLINKYLKSKILFYYLFSILIFMFSIFLQLEYNYELVHVYRIFIPFSLIGYMVMILLMKQLETSNLLFIKYKEESSKDFLTGLYNTRQYDLLFNSICNNIIQYKNELAYILIDIDFFKKVNDTYGHDIGDKVLMQLAEVLRANCKSTEIISRIGGEEFCVLSLGSNLEDAITLAEKLRKSVEDFRFYINKDETLSITISIGLSIYPILTDDVNKLKNKADLALYASKQNGRNRVSY